MTPEDCTFNIVINKGDLECVMCSSYQINRRKNIYRDEVGRVLRLGDLENEDGDNSEGGEGKGGTTTTPSTAKNAKRKDKKKFATTTAVKKNKNKNNPPP